MLVAAQTNKWVLHIGLMSCFFEIQRLNAQSTLI